MTQYTSLFIGILVVALGFLIGNFLAKETEEELKDGQIWFKLIILFSLVGVLVGLVMGNDVLLFTFAFISVVTSRSLISKKRK